MPVNGTHPGPADHWPDAQHPQGHMARSVPRWPTGPASSMLDRAPPTDPVCSGPMIRSSVGSVVRTVVLSLALLVTAGCGGEQEPERTFTRPADLPGAEQVTTDNAVVQPGAWGVVRAPGTDAAIDVIAIRVTSVDKGDPDALKDVRVLNKPGGRESASAVPYFVSYDYAILVGSQYLGPSQNLHAATTTGADGLDTLSVPKGVDECRTPRDVDEYPPGLGYTQHGCMTVAATGGTVPTLMVFDAASKGSRQVMFQLPAPGG